MPVKKGLLFYGPPGTGKTHTYLLLGEPVTRPHNAFNHLGASCTTRPLLPTGTVQPAMVVIEDVDLIARSRETMMYGPCDESILNKLLNEMDGLREDAEILFVLTTNRPQNLEAALASRPGRIDQAIEFPLPDEEGRAQLVRLYASGLRLDDEVVEMIVRKTDKASAAFIKELMRRSAQLHIQRGSRGKLLPEGLERCTGGDVVCRWVAECEAPWGQKA